LTDLFWPEDHKGANYVECGAAQFRVGFPIVDISDDAGHAGWKLGHGRLSAIKDGNLVPGSNRFTDRRQRYLAGTSDEQDAQRHRSLAPIFICFGVETDTGQDPDQG
jgi:hypothetical protein